MSEHVVLQDSIAMNSDRVVREESVSDGLKLYAGRRYRYRNLAMLCTTSGHGLFVPHSFILHQTRELRWIK